MLHGRGQCRRNHKCKPSIAFFGVWVAHTSLFRLHHISMEIVFFAQLLNRVHQRTSYNIIQTLIYWFRARDVENEERHMPSCDHDAFRFRHYQLIQTRCILNHSAFTLHHICFSTYGLLQGDWEPPNLGPLERTCMDPPNLQKDGIIGELRRIRRPLKRCASATISKFRWSISL
jgi:hypothetical protein